MAAAEGRDAAECDICVEPFNQSTRKLVECPKCQSSVCRKCVAHYIEGLYAPAHCMACHNPWSRVFLASVMTQSFMSKQYKDHRERVVFEGEQARLPEAMCFVQSKARKRKLLKMRDEIQEELSRVRRRYSLCSYRIEREEDFHNGVTTRDPGETNLDLDRRFTWAAAGYTAVPGPQGEGALDDESDVVGYTNGEASGRGRGRDNRDPFLTRGHCPKPDCNGFISEGWACPSCDTKVCRTCMVALPEPGTAGAAEDHECDPGEVESVRRIREECRPCPKCRVRVFKVSGCNQMWCANCHCTFDWRSGREISTRYFHNPHYAEWLRTNTEVRAAAGANAAGGRAAEDDVDMSDLCGNHVTHAHIIRRARALGLTGRVLENGTLPHRLLEYLTGANHIIDVEATDRTDTYEARARDIRVAFLSNEIDRDEFAKRVQRNDKARSKHEEVRAVKLMYGNVCKEALTEFCRGDISAEETEGRIHRVRDYALDSLRKINRHFGHTSRVSLSIRGHVRAR